MEMNSRQPEEKPSVKKISDDIARAFESCAAALSLNELSRVTGVRIELLRRFIDRKTRRARSETWDKIYPALKPFLVGPEPEREPPPRIGPAYRRHHELVEMFSDQKVLLDEFDVLPPELQQQATEAMIAAAGCDEPSSYSSLTAEENRIMGAFLKLSPEARDTELLKLTALAVAEVRKRRKELFLIRENRENG